MSSSTCVAHVRACFEREIVPTFFEASAVRRLFDGDVDVEHYAAWLCQIWHQTRRSPRMQALVQSDLEALGWRVDRVTAVPALPETLTLVGFASSALEHADRSGFLGYCTFMLELPAQHGARLQRRFAELGVPARAQSFFRQQPLVEAELARQVRRWLVELVQTDAQRDRVCEAMAHTARLYASMLGAALACADARLTVEG